MIREGAGSFACLSGPPRNGGAPVRLGPRDPVRIGRVSRPEQQTEAAPERNAAKEQLVSTVAAAWGTSAAERLIAAIRNAGDEQVRALLEELARDILTEAETRFGHAPILAEVWRAAANEAACARLSAIEC